MRFVGIDLFEARNGDTPGMTLKQAHAMLKPSGIKVQLVPGDPLSALMRTANTIPGNDLLLVTADQDPDSLTQAWFFVPRILHPQSLVLLETAHGWQTLQAADIERLASASPRAQRRAA
jgi:ABC-type transport system substrate-binding protein